MEAGEDAAQLADDAVGGPQLAMAPVKVPEPEIVVPAADEGVAAVVEPGAAERGVVGRWRAADGLPARHVPDDEVVVIAAAEGEEKLWDAAGQRWAGRRARRRRRAGNAHHCSAKSSSSVRGPCAGRGGGAARPRGRRCWRCARRPQSPTRSCGPGGAARQGGRARSRDCAAMGDRAACRLRARGAARRRGAGDAERTLKPVWVVSPDAT